MGQLTIYLDDSTLTAIRKSARAERRPVSQWAKERLVAGLGKSWPDGYWELFGSLADTNLERPEQQAFGEDVAREAL